jgi:hypothetical protein
MPYGEKHRNPVSKGPVKGMQQMPVMHDPVQNPVQMSKMRQKTEKQTPVRWKRMERK